MIADELSPCNRSATEFYPYYFPILEVVTFQRCQDEKQGGISDIEVKSFDGENGVIYIDPGQIRDYERNRITYFFDGWTKVEGDILTVDVDQGLMWPTKTMFDAQYQSSNPLRAEADIAQMLRIYNIDTDEEITNYSMVGNTIKTNETIVSGKIAADYYYSDLTPIITADLATKDDVEQWTNNLTSGQIRMAMFPWYNIAKGDIIVIAADAQFRTELLNHRGSWDQLWELEVFELNEYLIDDTGKTYSFGTDYVLDGLRYIRWLTDNQPKIGASMSIRYGYKPAFICFEDNPEPNNLENRRYPKIIYAKSWTKTDKNDIVKLMSGQE
jgi:hypothetical protein